MPNFSFITSTEPRVRKLSGSDIPAFPFPIPGIQDKEDEDVRRPSGYPETTC